MTAPAPARNHDSARLVDAHDAERWLNDVLVATSRRSPRGARSRRIMQIEKDIGQGRCRPWRTVVELLVSSQGNGVSADDLDLVARTLSGIMRSRAGLAPRESLNELLRTAHELDCRHDLVEWALRDGETSMDRLVAARDLTNRYIDSLEAVRDKLDQQILAQPTPPAHRLRMVAP
ncbi:MAG: hypothetical protein ACSLFE_08240 [Gemmatimonadaceae bacterium]